MSKSETEMQTEGSEEKCSAESHKRIDTMTGMKRRKAE